jgi:hypothetical protein
MGVQVIKFARFRRNCRESDRTSALLNSGKTTKQSKDQTVNIIESTHVCVTMSVALLLITRREGLGCSSFANGRARCGTVCGLEGIVTKRCATLCMNDGLTTVPLSMRSSNNDCGAPD